MSILRKDLTDYLDSLFAEYECPEDFSRNGLQVEGASEVTTAAFAVDARTATFLMAAEQGAQFLFCHHGLFWGTGLPRITGRDAEHIRLLVKNDISLYGMHLPLDAHRNIGNNARLADVFGIPETAREPFAHLRGLDAGVVGNLPQRASAGALAEILEAALESPCRVYGDATTPVSRVAIVSGAGDDVVPEAALRGAQLLVTGELGHVWGIAARELGVQVIVAGHYATETLGPKAVMAEVQSRFPELRCIWLDAPTGL